MVFTRIQMEKISREKLVEALLIKTFRTHWKVNNFVSKHEKVYSELQISRNCNNHLLQRIIQLERNVIANSQYHRRETIEINPVPESLGNEILEENVCKALSLTGVNITPEQLHLRHHLKKQNCIIVKFKCCKERQNVLFDWKNLKDKSSDLTPGVKIMASHRTWSAKFYTLSVQNSLLLYKWPVIFFLKNWKSLLEIPWKR